MLRIDQATILLAPIQNLMPERGSAPNPEVFPTDDDRSVQRWCGETLGDSPKLEQCMLKKVVACGCVVIAARPAMADPVTDRLVKSLAALCLIGKGTPPQSPNA